MAMDNIWGKKNIDLYELKEDGGGRVRKKINLFFR